MRPWRFVRRLALVTLTTLPIVFSVVVFTAGPPRDGSPALTPAARLGNVAMATGVCAWLASRLWTVRRWGARGRETKVTAAIRTLALALFVAGLLIWRFAR